MHLHDISPRTNTLASLRVFNHHEDLFGFRNSISISGIVFFANGFNSLCHRVAYLQQTQKV